jgi:hypothetical protein
MLHPNDDWIQTPKQAGELYYRRIPISSNLDTWSLKTHKLSIHNIFNAQVPMEDSTNSAPRSHEVLWTPKLGLERSKISFCLNKLTDCHFTSQGAPHVQAASCDRLETPPRNGFSRIWSNFYYYFQEKVHSSHLLLATYHNSPVSDAFVARNFASALAGLELKRKKSKTSWNVDPNKILQKPQRKEIRSP